MVFTPGSRILVTGASGFVGSAVMRHLLVHAPKDVEFYCPVSLRHNGENRKIPADPRIRYVRCDLSHGPGALGDVPLANYVLNIASKSGVEESIIDPVRFVENNVSLMLTVLQHARLSSDVGELKLFLHMGTDEEYGAAKPHQRHREWEPELPSNPYAASKAAQTNLAVSYWRTYAMPVVLTRTMNLIGEYQTAEKLVPKVIKSILAGEEVPIYVDSKGNSGQRHWIDVMDFATAWHFLISKYRVEGVPLYSTWEDTDTPDDRPDMWHIVGAEHSNLDVALLIGEIMDKPLKYRPVQFHASRPGHDIRYALDGSKLAAAGWTPEIDLRSTLERIVAWYTETDEGRAQLKG